MALFLAERYAEFIQIASARCEAVGEPLTQKQLAILLAAGATLLRQSN